MQLQKLHKRRKNAKRDRQTIGNHLLASGMLKNLVPERDPIPQGRF